MLLFNIPSCDLSSHILTMTYHASSPACAKPTSHASVFTSMKFRHSGQYIEE